MRTVHGLAELGFHVGTCWHIRGQMGKYQCSKKWSNPNKGARMEDMVWRHWWREHHCGWKRDNSCAGKLYTWSHVTKLKHWIMIIIIIIIIISCKYAKLYHKEHIISTTTGSWRLQIQTQGAQGFQTRFNSLESDNFENSAFSQCTGLQAIFDLFALGEFCLQAHVSYRFRLREATNSDW